MALRSLVVLLVVAVVVLVQAGVAVRRIGIVAWMRVPTRATAGARAGKSSVAERNTDCGVAVPRAALVATMRPGTRQELVAMAVTAVAQIAAGGVAGEYWRAAAADAKVVQLLLIAVAVKQEMANASGKKVLRVALKQLLSGGTSAITSSVRAFSGRRSIPGEKAPAAARAHGRRLGPRRPSEAAALVNSQAAAGGRLQRPS